MSLIIGSPQPLEPPHKWSTVLSAHSSEYVVALSDREKYNAVGIHLDSRVWQFWYKDPLGQHDMDFMQIGKGSDWYHDVLPRLFEAATALGTGNQAAYWIWQKVVFAPLGSIWLREQVVKAGAAPTAWHLAVAAKFYPMRVEQESERFVVVPLQVVATGGSGAQVEVKLYGADGEPINTNGYGSVYCEEHHV